MTFATKERAGACEKAHEVLVRSGLLVGGPCKGDYCGCYNLATIFEVVAEHDDTARAEITRLSGQVAALKAVIAAGGFGAWEEACRRADGLFLEVDALRRDRDKYKRRLSDNQEKFAWAKSQKAERVRLQAMLDTARRSSCDIIEDLRAELAQAKDLLRPLTGSTWDDDIDAYHLAAMRAFLATTTPVPPGARGLGTSALIQGATREPFIAARGASGSSTGPGSPKQGFFTPAQRLLPCLDCGKASGANSEHDWHHPFNPGVERGVPGPGEGSK